MDASSSAITTEMLNFEQQLAQLLGNMSLQQPGSPFDPPKEEQTTPYTPPIAADAFMSDSSSDSEDSSYQPPSRRNDAPLRPPSAPQSSPHAHPPAHAPHGCGLLQHIRAQLTSGRYPTTGGEYLEAIFTHREVFNAYPPGHRECALAFSDIASSLEKRPWRADRESDGEAVAAFRNEAVVIANMSPWW